MKCFKKLVSFVAAAALCTTLPLLPSLKADAATPATFYVKYDIDMNQWRMQTGVDGWNDEYEGRELYYLNNGDDRVKDGDIVVVLANETGETGNTEIKINSHLSNLTINRAVAVVHAGGIDNCYVLGESYAAINGDVTNAYVYDDASCTFNSNVTNLNLISSQNDTVDSNVSVGGTVAYASLQNPGGIIKEYYNFAAGSFDYSNTGGLMTDDSDFSKTGSGPAATTAATTTTTTAAATTTTTAASTSGAYDDVPKTGENHLAAWLFTLSALSFAGCLALRKKTVTD
ncbi:MAG: hypothetical protein IJ716_13850 [Lachnospiraceae bacterium]|nr:hypothetical protein [Lachnospiraceae bacterium]